LSSRRSRSPTKVSRPATHPSAPAAPRVCCKPTNSCSGTRSQTRFSEQLRRAAADIWEAQHEHPFVRGIADGTLDPDRFRFYIRQDYLFLIDYGRVLALACARAPRLELMNRSAALTNSTLHTEMEVHRAYAAEWGISRDELAREHVHPATRAYSDFLLRTAALGDFGELVAALLPCTWG
jgi:thiaminase/transcriptional activator TenA